jgi:hypothetical protein
MGYRLAFARRTCDIQERVTDGKREVAVRYCTVVFVLNDSLYLCTVQHFLF